MSLDDWLTLGTWAGWAVLMTFNLVAPGMYTYRQLGKEAPAWLRWTFRIAKELHWGGVALWAACNLAREARNHLGDWASNASNGAMIAFVVWMQWRSWRNYKDLDDDDWKKKLKDAATGLVERVGNRLKVVVPAPSPA